MREQIYELTVTPDGHRRVMTFGKGNFLNTDIMGFDFIMFN